jgi:hypothetical protein
VKRRFSATFLNQGALICSNTFSSRFNKIATSVLFEVHRTVAGNLQTPVRGNRSRDERARHYRAA